MVAGRCVEVDQRLHTKGVVAAPAGAEPPAVSGAKAMTQQHRDEENLAIERVEKAFKRQQDATFAVMRQMIPRGSGVLTQASLDELDAAKAEFKAARAAMDRIVDEIRTGKRR